MPLPLAQTSLCARVRSHDLPAALEELSALRAGLSGLPAEVQAAVLGGLVEGHLARGEVDRARRLGDDLAPYVTAGGPTAAFAHHARGELAAAQGDPELAAGHFTLAGDLAPGIAVDALPWRTGAALARLRSGDRRRAADVAREQVEIAEATGSPAARAGAWRTLAAVDPGPHRISHLRHARTVLADTPADRLSAQIDTDLAGLLLLEHTPAAQAEAVALLRSAEAVAGEQALAPLQARVRRLLDRAGERAVDVPAAAVDALTASERRVARMAVEGRTNREIAQHLHVTVKAVEWHLSHVYRKLGIASRAVLAATFGSAL